MKERMMIVVDLPLQCTGLEAGDMIDSIIKAIEPVREKAYKETQLNALPQSGEVVNVHDNDELIGFWEFKRS